MGASSSTVVPSSALANVPASAWNALNQTVQGRLSIGRPVALPCYWQYNNGTTSAHGADASACANIMNNKNDPYFMSDNFGGYMSYNFAPCVAKGQDCALTTLPALPLPQSPWEVCYQGCVPSYYVDARSVPDIQASLRFAEQWHLPVVVKNTGHDYRGRSNAPDSFAIWTHNFKPPLEYEKAFIPDGCSASLGEAVSYGAGQQFQELYEWAQNMDRMVVGGGSVTVGASGGWVTGGGHSFASNTYGLGVDNVLQMRVVLPNGTYVTANKCQNQDIFFALRGGGGGTFGIITETTSKVHPAVTMQMASITLLSFNSTSLATFLDVLIQNAEQWSKEGWGGYIGPDFLQGSVMQVSLASPLLSLAEAKTSMKPLTDLASTFGTAGIVNITTLPSGYHEFLYSPFVQAFSILNNVGLAPASRLIPRELFQSETSQKSLSQTLQDIVTAGEPNPIVPFYILLVAPAAYELPDDEIPPYGPGAASVTPAWRNALWHVFLQTFWDPTTSSNNAYSRASKAVDPLRKLAQNSGSYMNEADPFEPDSINSWWGQENYERLLTIKKAVDPNNIMTCNRCVGWDAKDARYACYPTELLNQS